MKNTKGNKILVGYIVHVMKFAEICSKYERQASEVFDFALAYSAADFVGASSNKLAALAQANPGCIQLAKEHLAKPSDSAENSKEYKDLEKTLATALRDLGRANDRVDTLVGSVCDLKAENESLVERLKSVVEEKGDRIVSLKKNIKHWQADNRDLERISQEQAERIDELEAENKTPKVKKAPKAEAKADNGQPSVEELRQIFPGVADGLLDWAWTKKCEQEYGEGVNFGSLEID